MEMSQRESADGRDFSRDPVDLPEKLARGFFAWERRPHRRIDRERMRQFFSFSFFFVLPKLLDAYRNEDTRVSSIWRRSF